MAMRLTDIRSRARVLVTSPLLTCIIVITVALTIGAQSGLSRVVNAVLLRPLEVSYLDQFAVLSKGAGSEGEPSRWSIESELMDFEEVEKGSGGGFSITAPVWVSIDDICLETLCRNRTLRFEIAPQQ